MTGPTRPGLDGKGAFIAGPVAFSLDLLTYRQPVDIVRFMETVGEWAERLARRAVPAEAEFAAEVAEAYVAGGEQARRLAGPQGAMPGAFGSAGGAVDLVQILEVLSASGDALLALLRSDYLANFLSGGSLAIALHSFRREPPAAPPAPAAAVQQEPRGGEFAALRDSYQVLRERLDALGLPEGRADELAGELLLELLQSPPQAAHFIEQLPAPLPARTRLAVRTRGMWRRMRSR